jgi:hypothetical protein
VAIDDAIVSERIRRGFAYFNDRDWEALQRGFPAEFYAIDRVPPDSRVTHGPAALREITEANGDFAFADLTMEAVEIEVVRPAPSVIVAAVKVMARASGGTSDVPVQAEIAQTWRFDDTGIPICMEQFRTWDDAREAARLAQQ